MTLTPLFVQHTQKLYREKNIEYYAVSNKLFFDALMYIDAPKEGESEFIHGGFLFNDVAGVAKASINEITANALNINFNDYSKSYYIHAVTATLNSDIKTYLIDLDTEVCIVKAKSVILIDEEIYED